VGQPSNDSLGGRNGTDGVRTVSRTIQPTSLSGHTSGSHIFVFCVAVRRLVAVAYPVCTLVLYALGYYVVLSGPHKVSAAVRDLNSALAELRERRRAEIPMAVSPAPAPSRIEWLMTDRALLFAGRGSKRRRTLASISESGEESMVQSGDSATSAHAVS
jgi:hypothetical protein